MNQGNQIYRKTTAEKFNPLGIKGYKLLHKVQKIGMNLPEAPAKIKFFNSNE
jgi:hypothetical protein